MANYWKVVLRSIEDVSNPKWRPFDHTRALWSSLQNDESMKDVAVVVECGSHQMECSNFDVVEGGGTKARIGKTLYIPKGGETIRFRVLKRHKIQKDALIGEAEVVVPRVAGVRLVRRGKDRGMLLVEITDAVPPPNPINCKINPRPARRPPAAACLCGCWKPCLAGCL